MKRWVLWWLLLSSACAHRPDAAPRPDLLAALELPTVRGGTLRPHVLRGRVLVVYFMSTWCFPCLADLPVLTQLHQRLAPKGATVLLVGMDLDGQKTLAPFVAHYQPPFPVLVADASLMKGESAFGRIRSIPTTVLFDRDGRVVAAYEGVTRGENLLKTVESLVSR